MSEITPNFEQRKAVDLAMSGHNVFLSGRAGTGKTFTVKYLVKMLEKHKTLVVTCTTGMACSLYEKSKTLHSFSGLKNSRLDLNALILSVTSNDECLKRWQTTDVLIIDEISQCSMKTFETINVLAQKARGNELVFGGMQVIGAGDFYQLPPVRNDIDEGNYCFESALWREVFPHTVLLQTVYRQDKTERQFLQLLGELASGNCSQDTVSLIKNQLSRKELKEEDFGVDFIPHIFCNNFDANFYNMEQLEKLPGEMKVYKAKDTVSNSILRKVTVAEEKLALKRGAEVMLLYNVSEKLRNGTRGRVIDLSEDGPTVNFYQVGIVSKVTKCSWFAYKHGTSDILGSRTQFPLKLAYAITAHKSQGQTLKAACVHSGKEFVPGQLYVACSRVSSMQGLSIVNFNEQKLIRSSSKVESFYASCRDDVPLQSQLCCTQKTLLVGLNGHMIGMQQYPDEMELDEQELEEIDKICSSYFTDSEIEQQDVVNLEMVLTDILSQVSGDMSDLNEISPLPLLDELRETVINTSTVSSARIVDVIDLLKNDKYLANVKLFANIQQRRLYKSLCEKSKKKKKNDNSVKFDFKSFMSAEVSLCDDDDVVKECAAMFNVSERELTVEHFWVMSELITAVRSDIIGQLYNVKFGSNAMIDTQKKSVWEMSKEGQGKVRYVGGWSIIKLIYVFKKYITTNCTSTTLQVRQEMRKRYEWIDMLESLLIQSANVHESSSYSETLTVTDVRQYRSNALVYVNDKTFEFFMDLEQKRSNSLCHENLNALKGNMLSIAVDGVKCNNMLKQKWKNLFVKSDESEMEERHNADVHVLYCKVVEKYFQMGAGQYIRDFRRDYNVTKTEAHRKRVQEKKLIKERQAEKVTLESIKQDTSENKQNSHSQLLCLVSKRQDVFETSYSKKEIEVLFRAYGKRYYSSWTKVRLNEVLVDCVKTATQFADPSVFVSS